MPERGLYHNRNMTNSREAAQGSPWRHDEHVRSLLNAERAWIARDREPAGGGPTVWIVPEGCEEASHDALELAVGRDGAISGAVRGELHDLPLVDGGVRRLILQHTFDVEGDTATMLGECARVLAAPGELVVFGFNPWSAWNPWLRRAARRRGATIRLHMAMRLRALFARLGLEFVALDRLGPRVPGRGDGAALDAGGPGRALYALRMRKVPSSVIVLPLTAQERAVAVPAAFATTATPRQAACNAGIENGFGAAA
jgi:hypothetical protein